MKNPVIKKGEKWYIQLAPRTTVVTRTIDSVTDKTVVLQENKGFMSIETRYLMDDIEFIEAVK